ncbi:MAG: regulatory protein RecX, partial [Chitinophagaceae bacterium]
ISALIEENYLNEERFAIAYAGGKFRSNHWGRVKIKYELKQRQVSEYCIRKAIKEIDEDQYLSVLKELADKKFNSLKGDQHLVRKKKTMDYLLNRGFEMDLIRAAVEDKKS